MTFGKRTALPTGRPHPSTGGGPVVRRGGFLLAVVAIVISGYLSMLVMALIPYFNGTQVPVWELVRSSTVANLNVVLFGALSLFLADRGLRALRISAVWGYAAASGLLNFTIMFVLATVLGSNPVLLPFMIMSVLLPTAIGGSVLGWFRSAA